MKLKIVIADDHIIVREGIKNLIDREPDMEVVGEADNGRQAVDLTHQLNPDVVIMDVSMPVLNGVEATRIIKAELPRVKVLALTMHKQKQFVDEILKAGASGYFPKECAYEEMAGAIRAVAEGGTYLSPEVTGMVIQDYVSTLKNKEVNRLARLSPREKEVMQLLAEGQGVRDIAKRLGVRGKTVETHRRQLMEKLGVHSVAELTKIAIKEGLTSIDI
ncbi:MAG: response regulator transcription factor [Pseudomonadota bacterium]